MCFNGFTNDWTQQLEQWHDFHLLIGGAAATLMGLTFVAVTLAPHVIAGRASTAIRAFITPIVAFFATVLIISVVLLVPHLTPTATGAFFAVVGISGLIYIFSTGPHGQWRKWQLGIDDLIWYIGLPLLGYGAILTSAVGMWRVSFWAPYVAAGAVPVLLIIGIRNAWDVVLAIARESQH
ncbi:MAG: hypothetical protein ACXVAR_05260 [Vulcanimicrobiaceae bacterium]